MSEESQNDEHSSEASDMKSAMVAQSLRKQSTSETLDDNYKVDKMQTDTHLGGNADLYFEGMVEELIIGCENDHRDMPLEQPRLKKRHKLSDVCHKYGFGFPLWKRHA
ncbi:hypothetical protein Unana1_03213 [Umbelopsis nana]